MEAPETASFWSHLDVLRAALLRVAAVLAVVTVGCFAAMPALFDRVILAPASADFPLYRWLSGLGSLGQWGPDFGAPFSVELINYTIPSQFLTHISTSFWLALTLTFPYLIFEVWRFVRPALYAGERRHVATAFLCGTGLFYAGCATGYAIVFPFTFRFLVQYRISETVTNHISLDSYMGNFLMLVFLMGLVFELPLLTWLLSHLGLVTRRMLRAGRRYAVVALLTLAAVITPSGDPFTLLTVFFPLYGLYELGIRFAREKTS